MSNRYETPEAWIKDCKRLVRQDWDNGILFTGDVGMGKSTWAFQVMRALWDGFGLEQCYFQIPEALARSAETPRYGSWLLDEAHVSGRKAMHGEMQRWNDYLQVNRGLNHHWGLCFHQDKRVDKPIMERVRWNCHIPKRGLVLLRVLKKNWESQRNPWRVVATWRFGPNKGALWETYKEAKDAHMTRLRDDGDAKDAGPALADLGFNESAFDAKLQEIVELVSA